MNKPAILLGAVALTLVGAMFMRSQRADAQLEAARTETGAISNQLSEAQIKLNHNERLNAALKSEVAERDKSLGGFSNQIAQLRGQLNTSRIETEAARSETSSAIEKVTAITSERERLSTRITELDKALRTATERAQSADESAFTARGQAANQSQRAASAELENQRLKSLLDDPEALRNQIDSLRKAQAIAKSPAPQGQLDYRYAARLEPDGTVTLTPPPLKKPAAN